MTEPITTELRGVMSHTTMAGTPLVELGEYEFASRCDAIDAVHANLEREYAAIKASVAHAYASGYEYAEHDRDGWVRLPVDADGVPWRIGDVTENGQTIEAMGLNKHGWHFVGAVNDIDPAIHRHHAPTVEDVLREFALAVCKDDALTIRKDVVDEYAAKLRLAGDAE